MSRVLLLLINCVLIIPLSAQTLVATIELPFLVATTDKLQHLYVATTDFQVIKFDREGNELYRYNNNYLGLPGWIDATNPINILCYYPDLQTIVTLDVTMNEISRTNLVELGFFDVRGSCSSNDGHIWLLDGMDFRIIKINRNGQLLQKSENLMLLLGRMPRIESMQERQNKVIMTEEDGSVLLFDNFANFDRKIQLGNISSLQITDSLWYYIKSGEVYHYDPVQFDEKPFLSELIYPKELLFINFRQKLVYLGGKHGVDIWRL
jgi:hypothetical protein